MLAGNRAAWANTRSADSEVQLRNGATTIVARGVEHFAFADGGGRAVITSLDGALMLITSSSRVSSAGSKTEFPSVSARMSRLRAGR